VSGISVHAIDVAKESVWSFNGGLPQWRHPKYSYQLSATFHPFPGYPHDISVVRETAKLVQELCPPIWDVEMYVADWEETGYTNAFSTVKDAYRDEEPTVGFVMFSGKRIPPHPGMTRHLVGHEYGHNVAYMLSKVWGDKNVHDQPWMKAYAKMRGLPKSSNHHGSGGNWHSSVREIFATDFRFAVCGLEKEYWPHLGVPKPDRVPAVADWWAKTLRELREYREGIRP